MRRRRPTAASLDWTSSRRSWRHSSATPSPTTPSAFWCRRLTRIEPIARNLRTSTPGFRTTRTALTAASSTITTSAPTGPSGIRRTSAMASRKSRASAPTPSSCCSGRRPTGLPRRSTIRTPRWTSRKTRTASACGSRTRTSSQRSTSAVRLLRSRWTVVTMPSTLPAITRSRKMTRSA